MIKFVLLLKCLSHEVMVQVMISNEVHGLDIGFENDVDLLMVVVNLALGLNAVSAWFSAMGKEFFHRW